MLYYRNIHFFRFYNVGRDMKFFGQWFQQVLEINKFIGSKLKSMFYDWIHNSAVNFYKLFSRTQISEKLDY